MYRIATMDCAVEEGEIRNALERVEGLRKLRFDLPSRTIAIDAPDSALSAAVAAIRAAGFDPQPVLAGPVQAGKPSEAPDSSNPGWTRLALALALALVAEGLDFLVPETTAFKGIGLAIAAAAIWLAGLETYKKGFAALRRGKLNINALMSWPSPAPS